MAGFSRKLIKIIDISNRFCNNTIMINKGSIRKNSKEIYKKVIILRKKGLSYSEIKKETGVAKTTINNWLSLAGLTLTREHLKIQARKRVENCVVATEASRITRLRKKLNEINLIIDNQKKYFNDPLYNFGVALYQAEGSKTTYCKFSNSDYKLILVFIKFIEKYFSLNRKNNMFFEVYIHENRVGEINKINNFWSKKIGIPKNRIRNYIKHNIIKGRKLDNPNYMGQITVRIHGEHILGSKLLAISDIILTKYQRV
jgi:hypothetical protein